MSRAQIVFLLMILVWPASAAGQGAGQRLALPAEGSETRIGRPATYGTTSDIVYVINAYNFEAFTYETTTAATSEASRYFTGAPGWLEAGVNLPNGARVLGIELQACDTSGTGTLVARLFSNSVNPPNETITEHGIVQTGAANAAGCDFFFSPVTNFTIDNSNHNYFVEVAASQAASTLRFAAVRIYYRLQVSAAPGTAAFNDVPVGHPLHRFVEALVAAGITGGCGGGNYCPDAPLSRGQMAVFLSAALGLHWPN